MNEQKTNKMASTPMKKLFWKMGLPMIISMVLQALYNVVDSIFVTNMGEKGALANQALTIAFPIQILIIAVGVGTGIGLNALLSKSLGEKNQEKVNKVAGNGIFLSICIYIVFLLFGIFGAEWFISLFAGGNAEVISMGTTYLKICCCVSLGTTGYTVYERFLQSTGKTMLSTISQITGAVANIILDYIFIFPLGMGVAGAAYATIISQIVSAVLTIRCLVKSEGSFKLQFHKLKISWDKFGRIARIGLPAGLQGSLFSISNVLIQSSVNSFGSIAMAGNTAATNIECFVFAAMNAVHQAAISFTGQNLGARKLDRISKILIECLILVALIGIIMGNAFVIFGEPLLSLYSSDAEVIAYGMRRILIICTTYCLCGIMDVIVGSIRGLGYAITPMIVSLLGVCAFRVVWIFTVFQWERSLETLYISYPVSWFMTAVVHLICFIIVRKRLAKRLGESV